MEDTKIINFEVPQITVPHYIHRFLPKGIANNISISDLPPGHCFWLYFPALSVQGHFEVDKNDKKREKEIRSLIYRGDIDKIEKQANSSEQWCPLKNEKRKALKYVVNNKSKAKDFLGSIVDRQMFNTQKDTCLTIHSKLTAPLVTGMGNPHPVENGFSFLSPYGVPYLPGSSIKGVIRRAAEELALMYDNSSWTIPMVWVLFGFEAGSAYLTGESENHAEGWPDVFGKWAAENADSDVLLRAWLDRVCPDKNRRPEETEKATSEIIFSWMGEKGKNARKEVHWKGLLRFWDAFPTGEVKLGVDIMNPHHKEYYEGKGSPHESEQPTPIFFLVLEQGAEFRFHVEAEDSKGLLEMVGDWRSLLKEAFNYAFDYLGFGAKTAVGYGAMKHDASAEEQSEKKLKAEQARREAEEKKRREEEERVRLEAELNALPEIDRLIRKIELTTADEQGQEFINTQCMPKLDEFEGKDREKIAIAIKGFYERMGKWNVSKKKKKQYKKVKKIKEILGES